jgi:hypothetical protein
MIAPMAHQLPCFANAKPLPEAGITYIGIHPSALEPFRLYKTFGFILRPLSRLKKIMVKP